MSAWLRLFRGALATALVIAALGGGWEVSRFGLTAASSARRLEHYVRGDIDERSRRVETLAARVAAEATRILAATASPDALPDLFSQLSLHAGPIGEDPTTVTVYVPGQTGQHRVLAWSDGPAGDILAELLSGPAAMFVAPGTAGLRLVLVQPVDAGGSRIAVVAAETVLSPPSLTGASTLETPLGHVTLVPPYAGAGALDLTHGFVIPTPGGSVPLLEVQFAPENIAAQRLTFRRRALALAACPVLLAFACLIGPLLDRRRRTSTARAWLGWSVAAVLTAATAGLALSGLARAAGAPGVASLVPLAVALVAAAAILPAGAAWRRQRRRTPTASTRRFVVEQAAGGGALAACVVGSARVLETRITSQSLPSWHSALFPLDLAGLLDTWVVLIVELALCWVAAALLAVVAARWRLTVRTPPSVPAVGLWLAPTAILLWARPTLPDGATTLIAVACALFALTAVRLRRYYRRTDQSMRLTLGFLALLAPLLVVYPMASAMVGRATRAVIEADYASQTAGQSEQIRAVLAETQREIDALPSLREQARSAALQTSGFQVGLSPESQTAFLIWTQTSLSRTRVISDVELYGPDRSLVSRFALNFPEYVYRASAHTWQGSGCGWEVFGEVTRFGASERPMLHAERGLCDEQGRLDGAVVVHVAPTDFQALPFVSSATPYADVLGQAAGEAREAGPPGVELVVYGWSLQPLFSSSRGVAWSIDSPLFTRLYQNGEPFWEDLDAAGRGYHVYVSQNRAGIYALGYPAMTPLAHATRLAEITAVAAVLFVILQIGAALYAPLVQRTDAPLRVWLHEIRTSYHRKLFLFFVLVAVGPVLLFALAFGAYMTARFRADVEGEAASVVTVARRVFEQVTAVDQPIDQPPTDDVMVWIREVIAEDVNLFDGPKLIATSQRDLFNSGLLPTRTPAVVYRRIALDRLPTFVSEGPEYLVAASPVPARGRDAVLSVPLAPRQREIERELDELHRGVLVGSVLVVLLAATLGASLARRVSDPVARLTRAARQIAAGRLDVRIAADTADELKRLVDDFNAMAATLVAQRAELARTNQLQAWNEMARQVAHEIKNPLTPVQLAAEHLQRVHHDQGRPLGPVFDQCVTTVLTQVRLLRRIASEFANFAGEPIPRPESLVLADLIEEVVGPYRPGLSGRVAVEVDVPARPLSVRADRTLLLRAITNVVENAIQAMPLGGTLTVVARPVDDRLVLTVTDTGVGMDADALAHAFDPYFSTKTGGSGLGLVNARRNLEREGGTISAASAAGQGTTISITLPSSAAPPDETQDAPPPRR